MKWNNKGHQFDKEAEILQDTDNCFVLWGLANIGRKFYSDYHNCINITGAVDSNEKMHGNVWNGLTVSSPDSIICKEKQIIIVTSSAYPKIKSVLQQKGFVENVNMFDYFVFMQIYEIYAHNRLYSRRIDISLTEKCTLKCKKCNMFMPYFNKSCDLDHYDVLKQIDEYFDMVDYVESFNLLGGEPLLYSNLAQTVDYVGQKYRDRMEHLKIFTNGTILPSDELLDNCKKWNVEIQISDYTNEVHYESRINQVMDILDKREISYYTFKSDEWGDFGFPDNPNNIGKEEVEGYFNACRAPFRGLYKSRVYFCHLETSAIRAGLFPDNSNDYFEIDRSRKKEFFEFDMGYNEQGGITFCAKCRGCYPLNKLTVPAAKQKER